MKRDREQLSVPIVNPPFIPLHASVSVRPSGRRARDRVKLFRKGHKVNPLLIWLPDDRWVFEDHSYPWRCIGKVKTPRGAATGTLVGPRHLLVASHSIDWTPDDAGFVQFRPSFFDTDVFEEAEGESVYAWQEVGAAPDGEYEIAEDYAVVVLNKRLGDTLGWLGTRVYNDKWDDENYWVNVGYAGDLADGARPSFQGPFAITDGDSPGFFKTGDGLDLETYADLAPGNSGGPVFSWWDDGPHIVGVVSGEGQLSPNIDAIVLPRFANWLGGGGPLVNLVSFALSDSP